jgi:colicin import membrane protein
MAAVLPAHRPQQPRSEQNTPAAFVLALAMHALLFGALWLSVQWHTEPAGAVIVELWGPAPPAAPVIVAPAPPPPPAPVKVEPEKERPDADIVTRKMEAEKQRALEEARRLETEKRQRELEQKKQRELEQRKQRELDLKKQRELEQKKLAEAVAREAEQKRDEERRQSVRKAEQARMLAQAGTGSAAGNPGGASEASGRGDGGYGTLLAGIIKPRIVFAVPDGTAASVTAEFEVELLPTGEILRVRLIKPSGLPGYDAAVERAIRRTDPFPRKPDGTVDRVIRLTFRPVEK